MYKDKNFDFIQAIYDLRNVDKLKENLKRKKYVYKYITRL